MRKKKKDERWFIVNSKHARDQRLELIRSKTKKNKNFELGLKKRLKMEKTAAHINSSVQGLLGGFSEMPLKDLEFFIRELNVLAMRKRFTDKEKRDKFLLRKINETALSEEMLGRYIALQDKMEMAELADSEYEELLQLVGQEEKMRNKRFQYLVELSQLRGITLAGLMDNLGLNSLNYA